MGHSNYLFHHTYRFDLLKLKVELTESIDIKDLNSEKIQTSHDRIYNKFSYLNFHNRKKLKGVNSFKTLFWDYNFLPTLLSFPYPYPYPYPYLCEGNGNLDLFRTNPRRLVSSRIIIAC
jgi:hypothetical protein